MGEFIRKFKTRYSLASESEIFNFIRLYLTASINENNEEASEFSLQNRTWIARTAFLRPYLSYENDSKYS